MAAYEIEVLEKADEDMRLIGKYIFGELKSPMAAERITDKIWDEIEKLSKNPYVYQVYIPLCCSETKQKAITSKIIPDRAGKTALSG